MPRRILAVLAAVLMISVTAATRLDSEPATTTVSTTTTKSAPTTTAPSVEDLHPDTPPNPLTLYPRRAGAKYDDIELRAGDGVWLSGTRFNIVRTTIEPRSALPARSRPSDLATYREVELVDGYVPRATNTAGDVLHVVAHAEPSAFVWSLACVATTEQDGTVLVPFAQMPPPARPGASTTTEPPPNLEPADVHIYLPLGTRRGRLYVTCRNTLLLPNAPDGLPITLFDSDSLAVWGIDV